MKYTIIFLTLFLTIQSNSIYAQTDFERIYQNARAFTNTNQDSAIVLASQCITLAKTNTQKYRAYYLRGFNSYKICKYGVAVADYLQAREFSPDSIAYFRITNNIANAYLYTGKYFEALKLNQQCINFNKRNKQWRNLSYNYGVKSKILGKQNNDQAIEIMREALKIKQKFVPKEIGYTYESLATSFATFKMYDSAILYQRLAIEHHPMKSSNKQASAYTKLAKYFVMANRSSEALPYLEYTKSLHKPTMLKLFWHHTYGLYFSRIKQISKAQQMFIYCDSLLKELLENAPDWITKRTISEYALEMRQDILLLDNIKDSLSDKEVSNTSNSKHSQSQPIGYGRWVLLLVALGGLVGWRLVSGRGKKSDQTKPATAPTLDKLEPGDLEKNQIQNPTQEPTTQEPAPDNEKPAHTTLANKNLTNKYTPEQLKEMHEVWMLDHMIALIEEKKSLKPDTKEMVKLYYKGLSLRAIGRELGIGVGTVRYRLKAIGQAMGYKNMQGFITAYKADQNAGEEEATPDE